jgi:Sigma-70, region 4
VAVCRCLNASVIIARVYALSMADREEFERSVLRRRWLNAPQRTGIVTVGALHAIPETRLLEIPMTSPKALADIAEALGDPSLCATDSIAMLGLPPAPVISERDAELVRMRQQGAATAAIARRFGISQERVRQILDREGW